LSNLGPRSYGQEEGEVFLGRSVQQAKEISDKTAEHIDIEVQSIIERNYQRAKAVLTEHLDKLHAMADFLMKFETIDAPQIQKIMSGELKQAPEWTLNDDKTSKE
jgi:cell division protease FtsH